MQNMEEELFRGLIEVEERVAARAPKAKNPDAAPSLDHLASPVLLERAAYLRKMAKLGEGSAGETLKEYPNHCTMLSVRNRSGEAEVHDHFADIFYVLDGCATLVTGGRVQGAKTTAPGETRGNAIEGGTKQELRAGDIAHVPAGLPHQMVVDKTIACLVVKVREAPVL